jgi:ubiquinone/menaquinone biosynthesis C-methylase UbiE
MNKKETIAFDYEKNFMGVGNIRERKAKMVKIKRFEYRMFNFLRHIKTPSGQICDVGCGGGEFLEKIKILFPNLECYGCDISKKAIDLAKDLSPKDINYELIKDNRLLYQDSFFDICTSFDVLEHTDDIEAHLKEILRILKKGGRFHLCVPCEGQPFTMTWFYQKTGFGKDFTYKNWGHIQPELTHEKMVKLLESAGFSLLFAQRNTQFFLQLGVFQVYGCWRDEINAGKKRRKKPPFFIQEIMAKIA